MRTPSLWVRSGAGAVAAACGAAAALGQPCQEPKIIAPGVAAGDNFGRRVAIDGDRLAAAAPLHDVTGVGADAGAVYVYRREGGAWVFEAEVRADDGAANDQFGFWIALGGGRLLVGAKFDDDLGADAGSAYVFRREGTAWVREAKLLAPDGAAADIFGNSVALNAAGDRAVVGAPQDDTTVGDGGSAHVFRREGTSWVHEAALVPNDSLVGDQAGFTVGFDGTRAVLGAWSADLPALNSGSAYVFRREGQAWTQEARLVAGDAAAGDRYGVAVSIRDDVAVVGADLHAPGGIGTAGAAYIYRRSGTAWTQERKLVAPDAAAGDQFGFTVPTDGTTVLSGSINADTSLGVNVGAVYSFAWDGSAWVEGQRLFADDGQGGDLFGCHAAFDGAWAVAGARQDDDAGLDAGAVYVFQLGSCGCYPDCDTSTGVGVLDIFDFLCFQNRFDAGSPYACECDTSTGPGVCDIFDFLCFQNAFDAGCP